MFGIQLRPVFQCCVISALVSFLTLACDPHPSPIAPQAFPFSALTLNIASGAGPRWTTAEVRATQRAWITERAADLIGLQEVDLFMDRTGQQNTAAAALGLDPQTQMHWQGDVGSAVFAEGTLLYATSILYGRDRCSETDQPPCEVSGTCRYGNALFVRAPHRVLSFDMETYAGAEKEEPRTFLHARVILQDGRLVHVINTHLTAYGPSANELRRSQLERLAQYVRTLTGPTVLMGDLNQSVQKATEVLAPGLLYLGGEPIDHIWANGQLVGTGQAVPTQGASDHAFGAQAWFD